MNNLPVAPVFRKKIVDYEIYTKKYPSRIKAIKALENYLVVTSETPKNRIFFDVINTETENIIFSYETTEIDGISTYN